MNTVHTLALTFAVSAAALCFTGCNSVDESAPTHPRTANILTPDENAKENADKRILETPGPAAPTNEKEFPGQSRGPTQSPVILASDLPSASPEPQAASRGSAVTTLDDDAAISLPTLPTLGVPTIAYHPVATPTVDYNTDNYHGSIPHLSRNPGTTPAVGTEAVPNTPWLVDNSWGEVLPLQSYPHRAWQETNTNYYTADVKNNPTYYFHIQQKLPVPQNDGSVCGDIINTAYEVPWFLANTAALPVLMVLNPPLQQRSSPSYSQDPLYNGYLPTQGEVVPSPSPGIIHWEFIFDKKSSTETQPTTTYSVPGLDNLNPPSDISPTTEPAGQ